MEDLVVTILVIIAFSAFTIWNVYEIVNSYKFYKKVDKQHKAIMETLTTEYKLKNKIVEHLEKGLGVNSLEEIERILDDFYNNKGKWIE
jgi:hypothetical protein